MVLYVLRAMFIVLCGITAAAFARQIATTDEDLNWWTYLILAFGGSVLGTAVVGIDIAFREKRLQAISGVFLGLISGMIAAYILGLPISFLLETIWDLVQLNTKNNDFFTAENLRRMQDGTSVLLGVVCVYVAISLILQTRNDFRFVIPYIEFSRQRRGTRPLILDTSILIDGRITEISDTQILQGPISIPQFVIEELQRLADSSDKLKRARGRRGLDILKKLQNNKLLDLSLQESEYHEGAVDQLLLALAKDINGRIFTTDHNLEKVAQVRDIDVINLHQLATALRPAVLPGEPLNIKIIKAGENANQGVGYLEDGTMVVVENTRNRIGEFVNLTVTSSLQTAAGRMVFGALVSETGSVDGVPGGDLVRNAKKEKQSKRLRKGS